MIDERFSAAEFETLAASPAEREQLLADLEREIVAEMEKAAAPAFGRLASRLRDLGHRFVSDDDEVADHHSRGYVFREVDRDGSEAEDSLHIHFDFIVTAAWGYKQRP